MPAPRFELSHKRWLGSKSTSRWWLAAGRPHAGPQAAQPQARLIVQHIHSNRAGLAELTALLV